MKKTGKENLGIVGLGAAACAACCAGPIVGVVASIAATGALAATVFGLAAFVVAALALVLVIVVLRRRQKAGACTMPGPVSVDAPVRRAPTA